MFGVTDKKNRAALEPQECHRGECAIEPDGTSFAEATAFLTEIGKGFHVRGWVLGRVGTSAR